MNDLRRDISPSLHIVSSILLDEPGVWTLDNGLTVYATNEGDQTVTKIELLIPAGRWQEPGKGVSFMTIKMLIEGTKNYTAQQLADEIEYYGASFKLQAGYEFSSITIYVLNKHLEKICQILAKLLLEPVFPESQLDLLKKLYTQKLLVNLEQVDYIANKTIAAKVFGEDHPFGYMLSEKDYSSISRDALKSFHRNYYSAKGSMVFIAGNLPDNAMEVLNNTIGHLPGKDVPEITRSQIDPDKARYYFVERPKAEQAAIRVGMPAISRMHDDYIKLQFVVRILGGYFGSRLMTNIREEKGFTYGIHAFISSFKHGSVFKISSEVGTTVWKQALKEITFEIDRLKTEPVGKDELETVRNYTMGRLLSQTAGPFKKSAIIKDLVCSGMDTDHFRQHIESIKAVSSQDIIEISNKYFNHDKMKTVVVADKQ